MDEIRSGFHVSENRKKLWSIELQILDAVDAICRKNGLRYFLVGGCAIGAVRHGGFIPWDDDIDIAMFRTDFEKLCDLLKDSDIIQRYCIHYGCDQFHQNDTFLRIRDRHSTAIIRSELERKDWCHGVFLEIYPLDNVPDDETERKKQVERARKWERLAKHCIYGQHYTGVKALLDRFFISKPVRQLVWRLWQHECTRYNKVECKRVDTVSLSAYAGTGCMLFDKNQVENTVDADYEGRRYMVAAGNDHCLRQQYGDYMQLPPENERGRAHSRVVFFDAERPYTDYAGSPIVANYFAGEGEDCL